LFGADIVKIGQVIRLRNFRHYGVANPDAKMVMDWMEYKHPDKDKVFVVMLLGEESKDGSVELDCEKRLNEMGWFRKNA